MTDINERFHKLRIEGKKIFLDDFELKGVGDYCLTNRSDGKCRRTELELKLLFPLNGDVSIRALEWMKAYDAVLPPEVKLEFKRAQNAKAYAAAVEGDLHRAGLRNKYLEERMKYFKRMARGQLLLSGALVIAMIIILLCRA